MRSDPTIIQALATATGAQAAIKNVAGACFYTIQVKGVGAGATAWTVALEGSNDGVNWSSIISHGTADVDGTVKNSGATPIGTLWVRVNVSALTLGSATGITISVFGVQ